MIISFELYTIVYIIILIPVVLFLMRLAWWFADITVSYLRVKTQRKLVEENQQILRDNMREANKLIQVQRDLREELELTEKGIKNEMKKDSE